MVLNLYLIPMGRSKKHKKQGNQKTILAYTNQQQTISIQSINYSQKYEAETKKLMEKIIKIRSEVYHKKLQEIQLINKLLKIKAVQADWQKQNDRQQKYAYELSQFQIHRNELPEEQILSRFPDPESNQLDINNWFDTILYYQHNFPKSEQIIVMENLENLKLKVSYLNEYQPTFRKTLNQLQNRKLADY